MAVNLVTITGNLESLLGADVSAGRLWFKITRPDWNVDGEIFAPEYVQVVADVGGAFSVALQSTDDFENGSTYSAILKYFDPLDGKAKEYTVATFAVPTGGPYQLGDLLTVGTVAPVPADVLALAIAAQVAAEASASASAAQVLLAAEQRVGAEAAATASAISAALAETYSGVTWRAGTWTELAAIAGAGGDTGYVGTSDEGTHTDPISALTVPNSGVYVWDATGLGSAQALRVGDTGLADVVKGEAVSGGAHDVILAGSDNFRAASFGASMSDIGPFSFEATTDDRIIVAGNDGFIFGVIPFVGDAEEEAVAGSAADTTLWLGPNLYGIDGEDFSIFTAGLLEDRADVQRVRVSIIGDGGRITSGMDQIPIRPDLMGTEAKIQSRARSDVGGTFSELTVACYAAPKTPTLAEAMVVLSIGDSITNRSGTAWAGWYLDQWGYSPAFIGTLVSTDETLAGDTATGRADEGKPGHSAGDFTYDYTDLVGPLPPGDEATYAGLGTADKRLFNTFLRASTGGDDPGDIRNGYVLDFPFYISRHAKAAPTVLWYGYGTNDIRDEAGVDIETALYERDSLIYRRWYAGYPTRPVVRWMPGTGWGTARNLVWKDSYINAIRGMIRAAQDAPGPVLLVPTWAMHSAEGEFDLDAVGTPDPVSGEVRRVIEDPVHPTGGNRREMFRALAAGLACAATANYGV